MKEQIKSVLNFARTRDIYPDLKIVESLPTSEVIVDGKKVLMFSSNNYLGLSQHPEVIEAAIAATRQYGAGSDGSRLLSGNLKIHNEFEEKIAQFKGGEAAIAWPSGYSANVGTVTALMDPLKVQASHFLKFKGIVFSDALNHASIIDGIKMSRRKKVIFKHCDVEDLERKMKWYPFHPKLVVTDSVFSMDGDIAPLDKLVEVCKKHKAMLMIDEAHATGILGKNGHGTAEHFGLKPIKDIDVVLGTCSKALASSGGFVVGDKDLIDYLRVASRSYMFSTAVNPAASGALIKVLEILERDPSHRQKLWENVKYTRESLKESGFDTSTSETQIIPILIGEDKKAIEFSRRLFAKGIYAPSVRWPAVEKNKARIRMTIMSTHTKEQLDHLIKSCKEIKGELKF